MFFNRFSRTCKKCGSEEDSAPLYCSFHPYLISLRGLYFRYVADMMTIFIWNSNYWPLITAYCLNFNFSSLFNVRTKDKYSWFVYMITCNVMMFTRLDKASFGPEWQNCKLANHKASDAPCFRVATHQFEEVPLNINVDIFIINSPPYMNKYFKLYYLNLREHSFVHQVWFVSTEREGGISSNIFFEYCFYFWKSHVFACARI